MGEAEEDPFGKRLRDRSVSLFGNGRVIEVVLALAAIDFATATTIAAKYQTPYTLCRDVLLRLAKGDAITSTRAGNGRRAPVQYFPSDTAQWHSLVGLAQVALEDVVRSALEAGEDVPDAFNPSKAGL